MPRDTSGPAFPEGHQINGGLTKRELFMALTLPGFLACYANADRTPDFDKAADMAARYTDAALARLAQDAPIPARPSLQEVVNRFLTWQLPPSVCSDRCVTEINYPHQRTGTNLLTAHEAEAMLRHVLNWPE